MEPIISPWLFYLADVCDNLKCIIAIVAVITAVFVYIGPKDICDNEDEFWKFTKKFFIGAIILAVIYCFTSSSNGIYKMMVSSVITPNNVEQATDYGKDIVDYILKAKWG